MGNSKNILVNFKKIGCFIFDTLKNFLSGADIILISEGHNWVIHEECITLKNNLEKNSALKIKISTSPFGLNNKIIHFFSENTLVRKDKILFKKRNNRIILTWFHISQDDTHRLHLIPKLNEVVDFVHTASDITVLKLIENGLFKEKIIKIPLGVDLSIFKPITREQKDILKNKLSLPSDKIIIGSFQKDGNGWGEGLTPKLIKGPDIFCDVIVQLSKEFPIHILLTGPSRGYVKKRLQENNITYSHFFYKDPKEIAKLFPLLDLYLITSREEGGPKALLESMASGTPLVSTRVGMCPEVIVTGENGYLVEIEDTAKIVKYSQDLLGNKNLREALIEGGLRTISHYDSQKISLDMYSKLYKPLLQ